MGALVADAALAVQYTNAGTFEFLLDDKGHFYFMEVNTRVQVEHPVTEFVTGLDIVKEQIRIAEGEPMSLRQADLRLTGHAIECRINAEDPARGFMPHPGLLEQVVFPGGPGIRVDSHVHAGYRVPPNYDSLIAKIIAWGRDRPEAIARMRRALAELRIDGVPTTAGFLARLLASPTFVEGAVHTRYVEQFIEEQPS